MDITLTIPYPVIVAPAKFKFRYKLLPGGSYSAYQDEDNDPFTLTGLAEGKYQYEAIYVTPEGIECDPVIGFFQVVEPDPCNDFLVEILYNDQSRAYMHVTYTPPGNSPCGYLLTWLNNNTLDTGTITILTLDPSGFMDFFFQNQFAVTDTFDITIQAILCNGLFTDCYHETVTPELPPCTGIVINSASAQFQPGTPLQLLITLNITQSTPITLVTNINYQQTNIITNGTLDNGMIPTALSLGAGATGNISFTVFPNPNYTGIDILYSGSLTDQCNTTHVWSVSFAT